VLKRKRKLAPPTGSLFNSAASIRRSGLLRLEPPKVSDTLQSSTRILVVALGWLLDSLQEFAWVPSSLRGRQMGFTARRMRPNNSFKGMPLRGTP
jgi:hypothetical protein